MNRWPPGIWVTNHLANPSCGRCRALGLPRQASPGPAGPGLPQISDGTVLVRVDLDD